MILNVFVSIGLLYIFSPFSLTDLIIFSPEEISLSLQLPHPIILIGLLLLHELIHAIFIPNFLSSNKTALGITYFGGFVYSEDVISKKRFILSLLAPFVLLSIILPGILDALGLLNPTSSLFIQTFYFILLNAAGSCVDVFSVILILTQAPADSYLTCNGMKTYWKQLYF